MQCNHDCMWTICVDFNFMQCNKCLVVDSIGKWRISYRDRKMQFRLCNPFWKYGSSCTEGEKWWFVSQNFNANCIITIRDLVSSIQGWNSWISKVSEMRQAHLSHYHTLELYLFWKRTIIAWLSTIWSVTNTRFMFICLACQHIFSEGRAP